jgi:hypothetical protein
MNILSVVENLTEEMYQRFLCAAETGKWPEGVVVAPEQRETALQIVMAYQSKVLKSDEIMTIGPNGEIVNKPKHVLKNQFKQPSTEQATTVDNSSRETIAKFSDL